MLIGLQLMDEQAIFGLIVLIVMTVTSTTQIIDIVDFQEKNGPLFLYLPLETILFLILIVIILMVQVKEIFLVQLGVQLMLLVDIILI